MKNSRTSTKPNKVKSKKAINNKSTSPSSKKVVKKNNVKRQHNTKNINRTNTENINVYRKDEDIYSNVFENLYPSQIEKQNNVKKEEKKRRIKPITILKFTFFIAILVVLVYLMFTLEMFNLKTIKIEGNEKYTDEEVLSKVNLNIGTNVFRQLFNTENIDLPYISGRHYRYIFPNTIVIKVEERYPQYMAKDKNTQKYYKIDNEGYLLEECSLEDKKDEILVEGFTFEENPDFGNLINEVYINKLDIYNQIKKQLENYEIAGEITKVNFSNSLTIIKLDDKLNIVFANDSNFGYKVSFLKGIIEQNGGIVEGTINMSVDNPVYSKYN